MSEERWAQQKEWNEERRQGFHIELKFERSAVNGELCAERKCDKQAKKVFLVGNPSFTGGVWIPLCGDHADEERAVEIYREDS